MSHQELVTEQQIRDALLEKAEVGLEAERWWNGNVGRWIQAEINADIAAIGACLSSRTRRLREQGLDFYDVADELAAENEYLKGLGLPVNLATTNAELLGVASNG